MVRLTFVLKGINHRESRFLDSLRLYVKGGSGGKGFPRYGGIGGKGGDIHVRAVEDMTLKNLLGFYPQKRVVGKPGEDSKKHRILGRSGEATIVDVPVGINVITDLKKSIASLDSVGQQVLVARGGAGGDQWNQYNGQKGQAHSITLDLKLIADIGFVGFPNAGKSTLLKALSRALPKIASYPFTTLRPNIGIMEYEDLRQISLADLPGLIEGAHANYGLGHKFLKHVERTKMLLFVVDSQGFVLNQASTFRTAFQTVMLLNKELELYDESLVQRPAVLVVTKLDTDNAQLKYEELLKQLDNYEDECDQLSKELHPSSLIKFDSVIPVCSHTAYNIVHLKNKLRALLDIHADTNLIGSYAEHLENEKQDSEIALI